MANPFFNPSGNPGNHADGLSALVRAEFAAIGVAFDMMPAISTTGVFSTTFNQQGNYTFTLPAAPGTLAMLADVAIETTARTAADTAEVTARNAAIAVETTARTNADTAEVTARNAAIAVETTARTNAGTAEVTARNAAIAVETTRATTAEAGIATNAAAIASEATNRNAQISLEVTNRIAASRGLLGGLGLSNDATSPNTVLDIAAGSCTDSTNAATIPLTAFTKSIASGAWSAGTGGNGMGATLTATNSTWYHVYAAIIGGVPDVFFDTTNPPTHAPPGTTAYRRIGSFKLDAGAAIIPFVQNSDRFDWVTPVLEFQGVAGVTTAVSLTLIGAPLGVPVEVMLTGSVSDPTSAQQGMYLSSLAQADVAPISTAAITALSGPTVSGFTTYAARVMTNASQQIRKRVGSTTMSMTVLNNGWIDTRGRG